ncbi:hypothetical protein [Actinoplanes xinjiangensis]|uniref:hypothetical protein n=1 Tax=Actinoplanes xinjiangensis TaxID=512350 RepID=UPI003446385D
MPIAAPPFPGATARLHGQDVIVSISAPPFPAFTSGAENNIGADIRRQGGLLLLITHAIDPSEIRTPKQMRGVLTGDRTVGGWVRLQ